MKKDAFVGPHDIENFWKLRFDVLFHYHNDDVGALDRFQSCTLFVPAAQGNDAAVENPRVGHDAVEQAEGIEPLVREINAYQFGHVQVEEIDGPGGLHENGFVEIGGFSSVHYPFETVEQAAIG